MKPLLALAACAIAISLPCLGSASILYSSLPDADNSSPNIFGTWSGSGSFTIAEDSILDAATFANWMTPNFVPETLDWAIQSAADGGVLASGAGAALTNEGPHLAREGVYDLYYSTFALPDISLSAGTYWLHISNCGTNATNGCGWGLSAQGGHDIQFNGSSPADIGKFAFSVQGSAAATPEPATWLMFVPAMAGLAAVIRRRRA